MAFLNRQRIARLCLIVAFLALFLPWQTGPSITRTGFDVDGNLLMAAVLIVTSLLMRFNFRPAWIGAGFVASVGGRAIYDLTNSSIRGVGIGLILVTLASFAAACILLWDMFVAVSAPRKTDEN